MLAAQSVIYTYDGWSGPIYFSEELDDPARQIPRSMFYGLLSVAVIYLLINIAFVERGADDRARRFAARGGDRREGAVRRSRRAARSARRHRVAAERGQCVFTHGVARVVFGEPRRTGNSRGDARERAVGRR